MKNIDKLQPEDELYMRRALDLALLGHGYTLSNPMVGAVLVYEGRVIGEGYHHRWGMPHAEVMAINSVKEEDKDYINKSILYVTLEPCSHYGKTPPCSELIIRKQIPKVVIAQRDPFPEVSGRGIELLKKSGVLVVESCLEEEAKKLNQAFNVRYTKGRPFVALKWAESVDGFIDRKRDNVSELAYVFSSEYRKRLVHRSRRDYQAILVGTNTAYLDNPSLTNRYWGELQPIRIILDAKLRLPQHLKVFQDGVAPTWVIYDATQVSSLPTASCDDLKYLPVPSMTAHNILTCLRDMQINSLYVEGGSRTLQMFIDEGLYDTIEYEKSRVYLGEGVSAPSIAGLK